MALVNVTRRPRTWSPPRAWTAPKFPPAASATATATRSSRPTTSRPRHGHAVLQRPGGAIGSPGLRQRRNRLAAQRPALHRRSGRQLRRHFQFTKGVLVQLPATAWTAGNLTSRFLSFRSANAIFFRRAKGEIYFFISKVYRRRRTIVAVSRRWPPMLLAICWRLGPQWQETIRRLARQLRKAGATLRTATSIRQLATSRKQLASSRVMPRRVAYAAVSTTGRATLTWRLRTIRRLFDSTQNMLRRTSVGATLMPG